MIRPNRFLLLITLGVVVMTSLPFVFGWLQRPSETVYSGRHSLAPGDFANYYQMLEQARSGSVLFTDPFTNEPHDATIFNPYWLLAGQIGRVTGWSNAVVFQAVRLLAIPLLLATLWWLLQQLFTDHRLRRFIMIFCVIASGIGGLSLLWLSRFINVDSELLNRPMDLWVSEGVTFLTLMQSGHFIVATALIIIIFILLFCALTLQRWRLIWWAGVAGLFLFFFHPFHLPTIAAVMVVYTLVQFVVNRKILWGWLAKLAVFALLTMPAWLYQALLLWFDPIAAGRAEQNINLTAAPWNVLLTYGFLIPFACVGVWHVWQQKKLRGLFGFLLTWLVVQLVLIYVPFDWQRRLTQGLQIPLTIFAGIGAYQTYVFLTRTWRQRFVPPALIAVGVIVFCFSNLYVMGNDLALLTNKYYQQPLFSLYYPETLNKAFGWIKTSTQTTDTILAHYTTSNLIVAETAHTVFVGHTVETLDAKAKMRAVKHFYDATTSDDERKAFLTEHHIRYVVYGPIERQYAWHNPDFLPVVYSAGDVTIYRTE